MSDDFATPRRYRSDDRDLEGHDNDLMVYQGGNGDWYITIVKHEQKIGPTVRLTTSGTPRGFEGVPKAVWSLYRALRPATDVRVMTAACGNPDCGVSTGFCDELTFGSGDLDDWGYFEHPCHACARDWETTHPQDGQCWPPKVLGLAADAEVGPQEGAERRGDD
jgi:hypothetical protein